MCTKVVVADFTKPEQTNDVIKQLKEFNIDIGILVNNVGLKPHMMPFCELEEQMVKDIINVNVLTGTVLCHYILKGMKEKGRGAVINISSSSANRIVPYGAIYSATKHYMSAFTQAIAAEYAPHGITIQCVEPGLVDTGMTKLDKVSLIVLKQCIFFIATLFLAYCIMINIFVSFLALQIACSEARCICGKSDTDTGLLWQD